MIFCSGVRRFLVSSWSPSSLWLSSAGSWKRSISPTSPCSTSCGRLSVCMTFSKIFRSFYPGCPFSVKLRNILSRSALLFKNHKALTGWGDWTSCDQHHLPHRSSSSVDAPYRCITYSLSGMKEVLICNDFFLGSILGEMVMCQLPLCVTIVCGHHTSPGCIGYDLGDLFKSL